MESDTVEKVTAWSSVPFSDGHAGLRDLADREFTGAVTDDTAWLFMLNGRVIGVFDGSIERFADADGTAYEAPHPSLPLLYAMLETGGETRAKYYSEETPLSEVDATLKSGNFTGYVVLSENVLSGDYYTVYHGGKAMSAAFVGNNRRLITGDEAFERADDEVGIYTVKTVEIDVVEIPSPESTTDPTAGAVSDDPTDEPTDDPTDDPSSSTDTTEPIQGGVTFGDDPLADEPTESTASAEDDFPAGESDTNYGPVAQSDSGPTTDADDAGPTTDADEAGPTTDAVDDDPLADSGETGQQQPPPATDHDAIGGDESPPREDPLEVVERDVQTDTPDRDEQPAGGSVFDDESQWREVRTIPALDPSETAVSELQEQREGTSGQPPRERQQRQESQSGQSQGERQPADSTVQDLRAERERLAARVQELESEADHLRAESDELRRERERLANERDEAAAGVEALEAEVAELETTVESLESRLAAAEQEPTNEEPDRESVPVDRAYDGTNLFVRYQHKSGPTLDDAFDGTATREEVNENVRFEHHTDFDAADAAVDGIAFEEWLEGTVEFGFSRWIVGEFIHDVRETRNQSALEELYGAIPDVDRIQFHGSVDVPLADGGTESHTFDVVMRDRMGDPLILADLNDSREPATEEMVSSLVENATPVGETGPGLAGAFFVTTSYFEPGALETAHEATGGGLLRRERRKSFVKLSRKDGYHLCLVETRSGEYHVNVPEL